MITVTMSSQSRAYDTVRWKEHMYRFRNRKILTMSLPSSFDPIYFYWKMKNFHDLKLARNKLT